jgi:hypothetical protein
MKYRGESAAGENQQERRNGGDEARMSVSGKHVGTEHPITSRLKYKIFYQEIQIVLIE